METKPASKYLVKNERGMVIRVFKRLSAARRFIEGTNYCICYTKKVINHA